MSNTSIQIPADMIKDIVQKTVALEVAKAIGQGADGERFIHACVQMALSEPGDRYDRETGFAKQVKAMIREVAQEVVREVIAEHRPLIKKQIKDRLGKDASKWVEAVSQRLSDSVTTNFQVHVSIPQD